MLCQMPHLKHIYIMTKYANYNMLKASNLGLTKTDNEFLLMWMLFWKFSGFFVYASLSFELAYYVI